jgi:hypothetical protein
MNEIEMDLLIAQQRDEIAELTKANARLREQMSASVYIEALCKSPAVSVVRTEHHQALIDLERTVRSSKLGSVAFQDKLRAIDQSREA